MIPGARAAWTGLAVAWLAGCAAWTSPGLARYEVVGDAIPAPLAGLAGDAQRGRALVADRRRSQCLLCHPAPLPDPHLHGDLAPSLAGAGARWSAGQLRLRLVDPQRLVPGSLMPAYHRIDGLRRVDPAWQGRPLLSAQEIEDVVAWLVTLKE